MSFFGFHPIIETWFRSRFAAPTEPQALGWPHIAAGEHTLIAAPTGSGKTLTAFLACIDRLLKRGLVGELQEGVSVVYVSPLRALSNDMHRNLEVPLAEILELAGEWEESGVGGRMSGVGEGGKLESGVRRQDLGDGNTGNFKSEISDSVRPLNDQPSTINCPHSAIRNPQSAIPAIRVGLRTGDTTSSERARLTRKPPHILVTTPESLYLMLTAEKARQTLRNVETVIVDEIHALVRDKRGSHLALSLERLAALSQRPLQRIGLSATQKPIERIAEFLVGNCGLRIADCGLRNGRSDGETEGQSEGAEYGTHCEATSDERDTEELGDTGSSPSTFNHQPATAFQSEIRNPKSTIASSIPQSAIRNPQFPVRIVNVGHGRELDLAIETPPSELGAVCMHEQWAEVHARLVELVQQHRSTLIFVNTRRLAERLTHELTELLGEDAVGSHHGSLSAPMRLNVERRLKEGEIKAVVATASLELGIDVGYIDLVVQIGSPRAIATFLQRIGRSGHSLGLVPKGRLFALTRDELLEGMAVLRAVRSGRLDAVQIPVAPIDVLAQQIVAEVASREWNVDALFELVTRADPYRRLDRREFDETVRFLSEGAPTSGGRIPAYLHHDQVNRRLRARPGARIAATSNAGAIPEVGSYRVVTEPEGTVVGTLDEDFAVESNRGDVFLLGNNSWRIMHVRGGDVTVVDAQGAPPTIPFWRGEAPGRTIELSEEVSRLREEMEPRLEDPAALEAWLVVETSCTASAAAEIVKYVAAQKGALGVLPTAKRIIFERFFDETGGMQMVVHAPFGAGITRAWGFALRKRFCRSFDFELQATADDDGFILSIGPQHSFPIESMFPMVTRENSRSLLEQAVLRVPVFQIRWRWNATRSLLVLRRRYGEKVPPALQRFRADDVLSAIFPRLTGCQEHDPGEIELPDHPLARQTMEDCLHEYLNLDGLHAVLESLERGEITMLARDTREPSPFCYELLNANPYAFLDGGEIQERRTRAVQSRRSLSVESLHDLARLDPEAIAQVRREAQPLVRSADELHDVLLSRIVLPVEWSEGVRGRGEAGEPKSPLAAKRDGTQGPSDGATDRNGWLDWYTELEREQRATTVALPDGRSAWVAAERLPAARAVFKDLRPNPPIAVPSTVQQEWESADARVAMVRGLIEVCGPTTAERVAAELAITVPQAFAALEALEGEGAVLRGVFEGRDEGRESRDEGPEDCGLPIADCGLGEGRSDGGTEGRSDGTAANPQSAIRNPQSTEWCHRRLLARIHRLTMEGLRKQIEPVTVDVFTRFLTRHHGLVGDNRRTGPNGLFEVVSLLQGIDIPAAAWEEDVLRPRLDGYQPAWLDELCLSGDVGWGRLFPPKGNGQKARPSASLTRVVPVSLFLRSDAEWLLANVDGATVEGLSGTALDVLQALTAHGALFAADLLTGSRLLPSHLREALGELVARGLVTADGFSGLRELLGDRLEPDRGRSRQREMGAVRKRVTARGAGRWSVWRREGIEDRGSRAGEERLVGVEGRGPGAWERGVRSQETGVESQISDLKSQISSSPSTFNLQPSTLLQSAIRNPQSAIEQWAFQLLRRWGVVFRDLLTREAGAPSWFELLQIYRRLEARGEIRGGMFVAGVAGEQFALGDTVRQLRQLRDEPAGRELVVLSAADPLNLAGILTPQPRIPSTAANRIALLGGVPVAAVLGGEVAFLRPLTTEWQMVVRRVIAGPTGEVRTVPSSAEAASKSRRASQRHERPISADEFQTESPDEAQPSGDRGPEPHAEPSKRRGRKSTPKQPVYPNDIPRPRIW